MLRTLRDHEGTPLVALDRNELAMDDVVDEDGVPDQQKMHIQRVGEGAYLVRAVDPEDGIPDVTELFQ
jgi:hypothetical protein